jgi:hypothetical protein
LIDIYFVGTKVGNFACRHYPTVAIELDQVGGGTHVVGVIGVCKEVDGALAIQEEVVRVNGTPAILLGKDDNAECVTGNGCIVHFGTNGVDLLRRPGFSAHSRCVP